MDRNREGRRGGSGGGPVSAPRRPRTTGFKDSAVGEDDDVMDDGHNPRLRERAKKENSSVSSPQGAFSGNLSSRNKRKHQLSHKVPVQARSMPLDDPDETTEDTEMGVSEDDDDLPPPPISRRPGKLRLQGKSSDEGNAVDLLAVPRKARTVKSATMKRPQESPSQQPADSPRQQQSIATAPPSASLISIPLSPNPALKPGRRTKPNGAKPRASKVPKVLTSTTISEQEVEVAEALYDLARMVPSQSSPSVSESKYEVKLEPNPHTKFLTPTLAASPPESVSSPVVNSAPAQVCTPASPLSSLPVTSSAPVLISSSAPIGSTSPVPSSLQPQAEAPKRKRPRIRTKTEDVAPVQAFTVGFLSSNSGGLIPEPNGDTVQPKENDKVQVKVEANSVGSINNTIATSGLPHTSTPVAVSTLPSSAHWPCPVEKNSPADGDKKPTKTDVSNTAIVENVTNSVIVMEKDTVLPSSPGSNLSHKENEAANELPSATCESMACAELGKRLPHSPSRDGSGPSKFEIDLMAPPQTATTGMFDNRVDADGSGAPELIEETQKAVATPLTKNGWLDRGGEKQEEDIIGKGGVEDKDKEMVEQKEMHGFREQGLSEDYGSQAEKEVQKENLKVRDREKEKADFSKQSQRLGKTVKADTRLQKSERSGLPPLGWPGGLPPLGYYPPAAAAAVAAAWPATASINGASSLEENSSSSVQAPSFTFPGARQPWKRCSTHVYIAHFINWQQQLQRHPIWAATYGNTAAGLYGTKPYYMNKPLPPADVIFGNSAGNITGMSGGTVVGPGSRSSGMGLGPSKERGPGITSNVQGSKERVPSTHIDTLARKTPSQQPAQATQQQPSLSLQAAASPGGGNVPSTALGNQVGAGATATLIGGSSGTGSTPIATGSAGMAGAGVGTTNGSIVNAVQFQYLQAMMQQTGFPLSFPPPHFGPTFNGPPGHITQQATQFLGSPFYNPPLVQPPLHSQHGQPAAANVSTGLISSHKQQQHLQQGMRTLQTSGSVLQQQPPYPSATQAQHHHPLGISSQQVQRASDRDPGTGLEGSPMAESKLPTLQRSAHSQATSNMHVPNVNPRPPVLAAGVPALPVHTQDFSLMAALGGKQSAKIQHQQQQASAQLPAHQQSSVPSQSQQQRAAQHNAASPVLQMSLKGLDSQAAQAYSTMSLGNLTRSSVGPGPLGLAPVAAVMAPQGHAMLQNMGDSMRGHSQQLHASHSGQPYQHPVPQSHQQHPVLMQKAASSGVDENRVNIDESSYTTNNRSRDLVDDRKMQMKRGSVPTGLSRVDLEVSSNAQGSPTASSGGGLPASRLASGSGASLNLMASSIGMLASRQNGQSSGGMPGPAPAVNQSLKSVVGRSKASSNAMIASSASPADSSLPSLPDRTLGSTLNKVTVPGFPGQNVNSGSQSLRQGHGAHQGSQLKFSQRGNIGAAVPPVSGGPTPPMLAAAAMAKQQGQPRSQQPVMNVAPSSRSSSAVGLPASSSIPSHPLPPVSKSSGAVISKNSAAMKGSFAGSQKQAGGAPGRRPGSAIAPASGTVQGPSSTGQNMPAKLMQPQVQQQNQHSMQQQQNQHSVQQQHVTQPLQQHNQLPLAAAQQTLSQQYHQQQAHTNQLPAHQLQKQSSQSHPPQVRQQFLLQQPYFQQLHQQQQSSHSQGHSSSPPMQPVTHPAQQHSVQPVQQQQSTSTSFQNQQQQHPAGQQQVLKSVQQQVLQPSQQSPMTASFGVATNGALSLTHPNLTLGSCNTGRSMNSDGILNQSAGSRPVTPAKSTGSSGGPLSAAGSHRGSNAGAPFLQSQVTSSNAMSGQQQANTLGQSMNSPYLQLAPNSSSIRKLAEEKIISDGATSEHINGVHVLPRASPGRPTQTSTGMTMNLPPSSLQAQIGSTVKHTGQHFATGNVGESHASRSGMTILSSPQPGGFPSNSPSRAPSAANGSQNSAAHLSSDGKGMFGSTSATLHQGSGLSQHQPVTTTSGQQVITMTAGGPASATSSGPAVLVGQNSAGLVQP